MVPPFPMRISTTPAQPRNPARVTTNDGMPSLTMIEPWRSPIAAPASSATTIATSPPVWTGQPEAVPAGSTSFARDDPAHAADVADREVDLAEQEDEDDAEADRRDPGHLDDEVDDVAGVVEVAVLRLEEDRDQDEREDDRQAADVSGTHSAPARGDRAAERPGRLHELRRCRVRFCLDRHAAPFVAVAGTRQ